MPRVAFTRPQSRSGAQHRWRPLSEDELLAIMREDPCAGTKALFVQYAGLIFRVCRNQLDNDTLAQDATQQTFFAAYKSMRTCDVTQPKAWLATIARNQCAEMRRKMARAGVVVADSDDVASDAYRVREHLIGFEGALDACLGEIKDPDHRTLVELRIEEFTFPQIRRILNTKDTDNALCQRARGLLQALRACLRRKEIEP